MSKALRKKTMSSSHSNLVASVDQMKIWNNYPLSSYAPDLILNFADS